MVKNLEAVFFREILNHGETMNADFSKNRKNE